MHNMPTLAGKREIETHAFPTTMLEGAYEIRKLNWKGSSSCTNITCNIHVKRVNTEDLFRREICFLFHSSGRSASLANVSIRLSAFVHRSRVRGSVIGVLGTAWLCRAHGSSTTTIPNIPSLPPIGIPARTSPPRIHKIVTSIKSHLGNFSSGRSRIARMTL